MGGLVLSSPAQGQTKKALENVKAIVEATTYFNDPDVLAKVSSGLGEPMRGQEIGKLEEKLQVRGW